MLFNGLIALVQALVTVTLAALLLDVNVRWAGMPLLIAAVAIGTAGWFFFYAIFALVIRRNDAFNTGTSIFYFVFLFASSMFYPVEPLPLAFRAAASVNPITWQMDVLRYATIGLGSPAMIAVQGALFVGFTGICFAIAMRALMTRE